MEFIFFSKKLFNAFLNQFETCPETEVALEMLIAFPGM